MAKLCECGKDPMEEWQIPCRPTHQSSSLTTVVLLCALELERLEGQRLEMEYPGHFSVSYACLQKRLRLNPLDPVILSLSTTKKKPNESSSSSSSALTRCIGRVIPNERIKGNSDLTLHSTLFDFLVEAGAADADHDNIRQQPQSRPPTRNKGADVDVDDSPKFWIRPASTILMDEDDWKSESLWKLCKPQSVVHVMEDSVYLHVKCIYTEFHLDENDDDAFKRHLKTELSDRFVAAGSVSMIVVEEMCTIIVIDSITMMMGHEKTPTVLDPSVVVRLPCALKIEMVLDHGALFSEKQHYRPPSSNSIVEVTSEISKQCTGYEATFKACTDLLCLTGPSRPTGVLLTGCPGVGKTYLAECVKRQFLAARNKKVHSILLEDYLLLAAGKTATDLAEAMLPALVSPSLVIVDGIQVLEGADETRNNAEKRALLAGLISIVDRCAKTGIALFGVSTSSSSLPPDLVKVGRLEKEIQMEAPTFLQREDIIAALLQKTCRLDQGLAQKWANILASTTAGCVAGDIQRICMQASTRAWARTGNASIPPEWNDIKEAAQSVVPSQLALLDVVKPVPHNVDNTDDWELIHNECWKRIGGYGTIKKRIYRTVVLPWRRVYLSATPVDERLARAIVPPSGILFHGPPGCGKTMAAGCLASSLGLPMIRVRAVDVLDKWLGGSEATIRSLFARARSAAPSVLFFDEIDAIATNRSTDASTVDVMSRVLSTLLNEMDGVSTNKHAPKVLVVACTNRRESLDAALLRPGRLDEHIELDLLSNVEDIESVLRQYLSRAPLDSSLDLRHLAEDLLVDGPRTGAELEGICSGAVLKAMRRTNGMDEAVNVRLEDVINLATSAWHMKVR